MTGETCAKNRAMYHYRAALPSTPSSIVSGLATLMKGAKMAHSLCCGSNQCQLRLVAFCNPQVGADHHNEGSRNALVYVTSRDASQDGMDPFTTRPKLPRKNRTRQTQICKDRSGLRCGRHHDMTSNSASVMMAVIHRREVMWAPL